MSNPPRPDPRYPYAPWAPSFASPNRAPSAIPAYAAGAVFVACAVLSLVFALVSWNGDGKVSTLAGVIGIAVSDRITGNIDFGISATMTVACTTFTFALLLLARLPVVRWVLAGIGAVVTLYYLYAIMYLAAHSATQYIGIPAGAALMWSIATALAVLPRTGRALRRMR